MCSECAGVFSGNSQLNSGIFELMSGRTCHFSSGAILLISRCL